MVANLKGICYCLRQLVESFGSENQYRHDPWVYAYKIEEFITYKVEVPTSQT
jgi:hypothetical protein